MGNQETYGLDPTSKAKKIDNEEQFAIYESGDGEEFQKYIVSYDGTPNFLNGYEFRIANKHPNMVQIKYAGQVRDTFNCTQITKYEIVTQRIPYRLKDLTSIQVSNSLVILKSSLKGFRDIFHKHGLICVKDSMIGVNKENKIKVWLNHNYALNQPEDKPPSLQNLDIKQHQRQMVHNIFDLINSKTTQDSLWSTLIYRKQYQNPSTFDEALNLIENYAHQNRIHISQEVNNIFNKQYYRKLEQKSRQINGADGSLVKWVDTQPNDETYIVNQKVYQPNNLQKPNNNVNMPHIVTQNHIKSQNYQSIRPIGEQKVGNLVNPPINHQNISAYRTINSNNQIYHPIQYKTSQNVVNKPFKITFNKRNQSPISSLPINIISSHHQPHIATLNRQKSIQNFVQPSIARTNSQHSHQQRMIHIVPTINNSNQPNIQQSINIISNKDRQPLILQNLNHRQIVSQNQANIIYIKAKDNYAVSQIKNENNIPPNNIIISNNIQQNQSVIPILNNNTEKQINNQQIINIVKLQVENKNNIDQSSVVRSQEQPKNNDYNKQYDNQPQQIIMSNSNQGQENLNNQLSKKSSLQNRSQLNNLTDQPTVNEIQPLKVLLNVNMLNYQDDKKSGDIQTFKNAVNSSLVKSKQIKQVSIQLQDSVKPQSQYNKTVNMSSLNKQKLSYREMRKILFEQLNN